MSAEYTKEELAEFNRLTNKLSSLNQMHRIEARLDMPKFVEKHGKEKCDAMFVELQRKDANRNRTK